MLSKSYKENLSLLFGVIAIILSILFWIDQKEKRTILYQTVNPLSRLFDSENSASIIQAYTRDSITIREDVWLLKGVIWNNGDLSIEKSDVRKPLTISLSDSMKIIDYKIIRQKDSDVANFTLDRLSDYTLCVGWDYFDPNFGFEYQIVFSGDIDKLNWMKGGQNITAMINGVKKIKFLEDPRSPHLIFDILKLFVALPLGLYFFIFEISIIRKRLKRGRRLGCKLIFSAVSSVVMMILPIAYMIMVLIGMNGPF